MRIEGDCEKMSSEALLAWKQRIFDYQQSAKENPSPQQGHCSTLPLIPFDSDKINSFTRRSDACFKRTDRRLRTDYGQANFPTFWRRWAQYRKSGGLPGPKFVEWVKANKKKQLASAPGGIKLFSDTIAPSSNRLLVKPWEIVFEE